jgi:hypothetical protein
MKKNEFDNLLNENLSTKKECNLCKEINFNVGENTGYGKIICKIGGMRDGWFATLSPKTGGNPERDFTIQIMPFVHLTHFSQISSFPKLSENYGIIFSDICKAMTKILIEEGNLKSDSEEKDKSVSIGTYGKSTTWKEKKEHLHIKIFPFRGNIGQPYTVDSSFEKKEIFKDKDGKIFVKMTPIRKRLLEKGRFNKLADRLIDLLQK